MSLNDVFFKLAGSKDSVADAAYAVNWWQVLLADAAMGVVLGVIGLGVMIWWISWLGIVLIVLGVWYLLLVGRRFLQWRWLRRQAGL
jgi:hypothetical protein